MSGSGSGPGGGPAKAAHVNMMTDAIIANMPPSGLRSILRSLLGHDSSITSRFHGLTAEYLENTKSVCVPRLFTSGQSAEGVVLIWSTPELAELQSRYRCLMGCGFGFGALKSISSVVEQAVDVLRLEGVRVDSEGALVDELAVVDADMVQAVTAVQKELLSGSGSRSMTSTELAVGMRLREVLLVGKVDAVARRQEFVFERGLSRLMKLESIPGLPGEPDGPDATSLVTPDHARCDSLGARNGVETFLLGKLEVPRMFMGLWQFSSPAWGTASRRKINNDFKKHVDAGFTAYDMADHYGDAEVTFGNFRSSQPDAERIFCATKYCVFDPVTLTNEIVEANISERLRNINADHIDLLQLHWQNYGDHQYITMAELVAADSRVTNVGLCNFDAKRMDEIVASGVKIVSNQVQFSLIDLRPTFAMSASCLAHNIKLLAYGTLCGGFLADKWLGKLAPDLYSENMTPSHRKYYAMITQSWGTWTLFQELLLVLADIGAKRNVSISNVATRWVLEHEYVGAVIVGARMGVSEHVEENLRCFGWRLGVQDIERIEGVLKRSSAYNSGIEGGMGDCGDEYR